MKKLQPIKTLNFSSIEEFNKICEKKWMVVLILEVRHANNVLLSMKQVHVLLAILITDQPVEIYVLLLPYNFIIEKTQ